MATFEMRIGMGQSSSVPLAFSDSYLANDQVNSVVWAFNDVTTADHELGVMLVVPDLTDFTAATVTAIMQTPATTGNYHMQFAYRSIADGESGDPSTWQETVSPAAAAVPGTAHQVFTVDFTLTFSNLAASDILLAKLIRRGSSGGGSDTVSDKLYLLGLYLDLT